MRSVISTKEERNTMARRLGLVYSCTASINMVSVLREPAEPPNSRISACESSASFCAAVAGIQRYLGGASERVTVCTFLLCLITASEGIDGCPTFAPAYVGRK